MEIDGPINCTGALPLSSGPLWRACARALSSFLAAKASRHSCYWESGVDRRFLLLDSPVFNLIDQAFMNAIGISGNCVWRWGSVSWREVWDKSRLQGITPLNALVADKVVAFSPERPVKRLAVKFWRRHGFACIAGSTSNSSMTRLSPAWSVKSSALRSVALPYSMGHTAASNPRRLQPSGHSFRPKWSNRGKRWCVGSSNLQRENLPIRPCMNSKGKAGEQSKPNT